MYGLLLLFALCLVGPAFLGWLCLGGCIPSPGAQEKIPVNVCVCSMEFSWLCWFCPAVRIRSQNESMSWFQRGSSLGDGAQLGCSGAMKLPVMGQQPLLCPAGANGADWEACAGAAYPAPATLNHTWPCSLPLQGQDPFRGWMFAFLEGSHLWVTAQHPSSVPGGSASWQSGMLARIWPLGSLWSFRCHLLLCRR